MNLQTFRAPTMAECLADVKRVMGPDAVILHTRTLTLKRLLGLRRKEIVEITAGRGLNGGPRGPRRIAPGAQRQLGANGNYADTCGGVAVMPPREMPPIQRELPGGTYVPPQNGNGSDVREIMTQVKGLEDMMK